MINMNPVEDSISKSDLPCLVRVKRLINNKFVEFDFALEDPTLYVELVLPVKAFEEFCQKNQVSHMSSEQALYVDQDMEKWRYGCASESRKSNPLLNT